MHQLVVPFLLLAVACSAPKSTTASPKPKPTAEERAAQDAVRRRSPRALRAYLGKYPKGAHRAEVQAAYTKLADEGYEAAVRAGTDEAAAAHLRRFPEHKQRMAKARAAQEHERIRSLRDVKTVQIVYEYTEAEKPAEFPGPVNAAIRELCAHAGWTVAEGHSDATIIVRGNAATFGVRYTGAVRIRADARFEGEVVVRRGDQLVFERPLTGSRRNAPQSIFYPKGGSRHALDGGLDPVEGVVASPLLRTLIDVVGIAVGPEPLALALGSDLARKQPNTPTKQYMLAEAAQRVLSERELPGQVEALRPMLRVNDPRMRQRAVRALEQHWRPNDDDDEQERLSFYLYVDSELAPAIGTRGFTQASIAPAAAVPLHDEAIERVAMLLATMGEPGIDILIKRIEGLLSFTPYHRALGRCGAPAEAKLVPLLKNRKNDVRTSAARALVLLRSSHALAYYRKQSRTYDNGLGGYVDRIIAVDSLVAVLSDQGARGRATVARQLSYTRDPRAFGPLLAALEDDDRDVRRAAADALGWFGDARAAPKLRQAISQDAGYRRQYERAIWRIEAYGD